MTTCVLLKESDYMELDRETQIRILEEHFTGCFNFWKHQGMDEKAAEESALRDLRRVKNNPFSPRPCLMDPAIVAEVADRIQQEKTMMRHEYF